MRRAAKVDANQAEIVGALRSCGALVCSLAGVGQGVPDLLVSFKDRLQLLEVKNIHGKNRLSDEQKAWHGKGWPVTVVASIEGAIEAISA